MCGCVVTDCGQNRDAAQDSSTDGCRCSSSGSELHVEPQQWRCHSGVCSSREVTLQMTAREQGNNSRDCSGDELQELQVE